MANILEFNGGKLTRANPSVINPQFATRLFNVDIDAVVLQSLKGPVDMVTKVDNSFYNFEGSWQSNPNADYVEYGNRLYYSREGAIAEKFDGISTFSLGIQPPVGEPAVNSADEPLRDDSGTQIEGIVVNNRDIRTSDIDVTFEAYEDADATLASGDNVTGFSIGTQHYRICLIDGNDIVYSVDEAVTIPTAELNLVRITLNNLAGHRIRVYRLVGNQQYRFLNERLVVLDSEEYSDYNLDLSSNDLYVQPTPSTEKSVVQYTVTYYNADDGTESAPAPFTAEHETSPNQAVMLTNIPSSSDPQVTHKNIYRIGGELVRMSRVVQLLNEVTAYDDLISDIDVGEVLDSINNLPPDSRLTSLVEAYGIFFGLVEDELRWSEIGNPNYWPPQNSIRLRGDGTGLLVTLQGILVFTDTITYLLQGTNTLEFALTILSDKQGCISHKSCQLIKNRPLWISYEGVCTLESLSINVISKFFIDTVRLPVYQTEVFDEQYYILLEDGTINVMELKDTIRFYDIKLTNEYGAVTPIAGIRRYEDKLYFSIDGRLHEAFAGEPLKLEYTSPVLTDGNHSVRKSYNKIYIRYNGKFTITMYIDGILAQDRMVDSTIDKEGNKLSVPLDATLDFQPPANRQRGYSCQFEIEGTGIIYSIETLPIPREGT